MEKTQVELRLSPEQAKDDQMIQKIIARQMKVSDRDIQIRWKKRSIDARKHRIVVNATFDVIGAEDTFEEKVYYTPKGAGKEVHIVGADQLECLLPCVRLSWV